MNNTAASFPQSECKAENLINTYLPANSVLSDICQLFGVFSDVTRVKLLTALSISPLSVTRLSEILSLNQTTVSHQLRLLRDAGMVSFRREGKTIYYSVSSDHINNVMMAGADYFISTKSIG